MEVANHAIDIDATTDAHFEMGPGDHPEVAACKFALAIGKLLRKDGVIL